MKSVPERKQQKWWVKLLKAILIVIVIIGALAVFGSFRLANNSSAFMDAVTAYQARDYERSAELLQKAGSGYENAELYNILCQAHLNGWLSHEQVEILKDNLNFEDAKEVLLSSDAIAAEFLYGYWTADGEYSLECYKQGELTGFQWMLPVRKYKDDKTEYWHIKNSVFIASNQEELSSEAATTLNGESKAGESNAEDDVYECELFRMTILSPDTLKVFCFETNETVLLNRQH